MNGPPTAGNGRRWGLARLAGYVAAGEEAGYERVWYSTIGLAIVTTGSLAFLSGTLFGMVAFQMPWQSALFVGAFWSILIMIIDVLIVRQIRIPTLANPFGRLLAMLGIVVLYLMRLALAVGVAFLVAEPVVLYMFRDTIAIQLQVDSQRRVDLYAVDQYREAGNKADSAQANVASLQNEVNSKQAELDQQGKAINIERGGKSVLTATPSCGPQCAIEITKYKAIQGQLAAKEDVCRTALTTAHSTISTALAAADTAITQRAVDLRKPASVGYLNRRTALANIEAPGLPSWWPHGGSGQSSSQPDPASARGPAERHIGAVEKTLPSCVPSIGASTAAPILDLAPAVRTSNVAASAVITPQEGWTVFQQHLLVAGVLILVDLLPLSIKALGGTSTVSSRVSSYGAAQVVRDSRRSSEGRQGAKEAMGLANIRRRRTVGLARETYRGERHGRRLLALQRMREVISSTPHGPQRPPNEAGSSAQPPYGGDDMPAEGRPAGMGVPPRMPDQESTELQGRDVVAGRWELVSPLGSARSGYARLWRARDSTDLEDDEGKWVLKEFPAGPQTSDEADMVEEIRNTMRHRLPFVAPVVDAGIVDAPGKPSVVYFVTPHYRLGTFEAYLDPNEGRRSLALCVTAAHQITVGLAAVRRQLRRAHNDVKPQNVAVAHGGDNFAIALFDWGLSRNDQDLATRGGGTPFFSAPERWRRDMDPDASPLADVYGVGATLYWMITGEPPLLDLARKQGVDITDSEACIEFLRSGRPPTPVRERMAVDLPDGLARIVDRWVSPDPPARVLHVGGAPLEPGTEYEFAMFWASHELADLEATERREGAMHFLVGPGFSVDVIGPRPPGDEDVQQPRGAS